MDGADQGAIGQPSRWPLKMHFMLIPPPAVTDLTVNLIIFVRIENPTKILWLLMKKTQQTSSIPNLCKLQILRNRLPSEIGAYCGLLLGQSKDARPEEGQPKLVFQEIMNGPTA